MRERKRRLIVAVIAALVLAGGAAYEELQRPDSNPDSVQPAAPQQGQELATAALQELEVKGRAPKTGYSREQFGDGWQTLGDCDVRSHILARDLDDTKVSSDEDCTVLSGVLEDPYTGKRIVFTRGAGTSSEVQIDHVVALSDAWQKGAQQLPADTRQKFSNDPLNLLAVDGPANQKKSDGDAATWLPPNKSYRCRYIARQIAVKTSYELWVTQAERDAMQRVLGSCPNQVLPAVSR